MRRAGAEKRVKRMRFKSTKIVDWDNIAPADARVFGLKTLFFQIVPVRFSSYYSKFSKLL
jgi:hypothetical protein